MNQDTQSVVGIDLGTTNSTIAVVRNGELIIIPVSGKPTMPSAVGIDPAGKLVIGQTAKNQSISAPENTVLSIKRGMGGDTSVKLGGKSYRPEEISALILGELKRAAEEYLGHPVSRAVITVPAFFNERQRLATQDAGRLAGLEVMRIINEPTAAALAYGAGQTGGGKQETLLVYDLGGGTFDVSVVRVEDGIVEVRASHGDVHLGGDDFDEALAKLGEERFGAARGDAAEALSDAARRRLKGAMERAKIALSDAPFASVREEYLTAADHLETEIERREYEQLIEPWLHKTLDSLQSALADAGVTADELDKVMLVGGATPIWSWRWARRSRVPPWPDNPRQPSSSIFPPTPTASWRWWATASSARSSAAAPSCVAAPPCRSPRPNCFPPLPTTKRPFGWKSSRAKATCPKRTCGSAN
jgi:molecular chaperone DnaK